jgi:hypothetical protein
MNAGARVAMMALSRGGHKPDAQSIRSSTAPAEERQMLADLAL